MENKSTPGLRSCLILLNRGLLVIYDITSDDVIWTSGNEWRDESTLEDLRKELISETEKPLEMSYDLRTKKTQTNVTLVQHRGTISIMTDQDGNEEIW